MSRCLLSVVIPVYNVEKYLKKCLNSVLNQEFKDFEVICIDDCSTDNSFKILNEYARNDERIKILKNDKNLGLGPTRNKGIEIAAGDYIHFLDSDDFLNNDAYISFYEAIMHFYNIDVIAFGYDIYDENTKKINRKVLYPLEDFYSKVVNFETNPNIADYWGFPVWTKIVNAQFLKKNNLFFNDNRCQEDIEFSMKLLLKANSIIFKNESLLTYRENRKNSLVSNRSNYLSLLIEDISKLETLIETCPFDLKQKFLAPIYSHFIICVSEAYYYGKISFIDLKAYVNQVLKSSSWLKNDGYIYQKILYNKIIKYNEFKFRYSYCFREFIKKNFPTFWETYFILKKVLGVKNNG